MTEHYESENLTNIGVSAKLGGIRNALLARGNELEALFHLRVGDLVNDILKQTEEHACRIAFIGQVKAGKSSLINALIQKPDFLPTDVNPSTAVVTKLILGSRSQGGNSALFHFFTEEEWDDVLSGSTVTRSRKQKFALPSARKKLSELQRRAERRLGSGYSGLLGKHRLLSAVTPEDLKQYVSASERFDENDTVYSDITRMAEVHLESQTYLYPSIIIDTPGVNDLFFVRDDVTFANLADADIYVLLLSAQQPISNSDLSLLRLLRGLQKDKIIAVINRIDLLGNPAEMLAPLQDYVRQTLVRECPQASVSVIPVSALWGNAALRRGTPDTAIPVTQHLLDYARSLGFESDASAEPNNRQIINICSGIPRLIKLMSKMMANAITEEQLLPGASTLAAIAHNAATSWRFAHRELSFDVISKTGTVSESQLKRRAHDNLKQINLLIKNMDSLLTESMASIESLIVSETQSLENFVFRSASAFAEEQSRTYFHSQSPAFSESFSRAALVFRSELADGFARYYTGVADVVGGQLRATEKNLRNTIKSMLPSLDGVVQFGVTPRSNRVSSVVSLGKATPLESAEFWEWFTGLADKNEETLRRLIVSEFIAILNEITETGGSGLRLFASNGLRRLKLLGLGAVVPVAEHIEMLVGFYQEGTKAGSGAVDAAAWAAFEKKVQTGIGRYEVLLSEFNDLKKQCFLAPSS